MLTLSAARRPDAPEATGWLLETQEAQSITHTRTRSENTRNTRDARASTVQWCIVVSRSTVVLVCIGALWCAGVCRRTWTSSALRRRTSVPPRCSSEPCGCGALSHEALDQRATRHAPAISCVCDLRAISHLHLRSINRANSRPLIHRHIARPHECNTRLRWPLLSECVISSSTFDTRLVCMCNKCWLATKWFRGALTEVHRYSYVCIYDIASKLMYYLTSNPSSINYWWPDYCVLERTCVNEMF